MATISNRAIVGAVLHYVQALDAGQHALADQLSAELLRLARVRAAQDAASYARNQVALTALRERQLAEQARQAADDEAQVAEAARLVAAGLASWDQRGTSRDVPQLLPMRDLMTLQSMKQSGGFTLMRGHDPAVYERLARHGFIKEIATPQGPAYQLASPADARTEGTGG